MWQKMVFLFILCSGMIFLTAEDWDHWRGPQQNGFSQEKNLPNSWSSQGENLLWDAPYGARTTPLVMGNNVYLINRAGEGVNLQERVMALDVKNGKLLWEHRFNVFHTDIVANRLGWANLEGDKETGHIYAHGVQGRFFCFTSEGKILWSRSLTEELGRISGYGGRTNSPIVDGNLVIISFLSSGWAEHGRGMHRFLAMNKLTGEIVWWSSPGQAPLDTTYSVPVIANINGIRTLVTGCADGFIYGIKVKTGEKLWGFHLSKRGINSSVVVDGNIVYASHSEENIDSSTLGRVVAIDAGKTKNMIASELWRVDGLKAGYTSPILHKDKLYVFDNSANLICLDKSTGKEKWHHNYGRAAKGSGVYADGKIYVGEVSGRFYILKVTKNGCQELDSESFTLEDGSPIEINGNPAIANGRVFLPTNTNLYCIGLKNEVLTKTKTQNTPKSKEEVSMSTGEVAHLQIVPGETWLSSDEKKTFRVELFNASGHCMGQAKAKWSLSGLQGEINEDGVFTPSSQSQQAGKVVAQLGHLTTQARVRVIPPLPYQEDFENLPVEYPPPGWISSKLKCQVKEYEGNKVLWKLANRSAPPFARLKAYMQPPIKTNYTVQADMKGMRKKFYLPDMGLINSRYTLILLGTTFSPSIRIVSWDPIPRLQKDLEFSWSPNTWYRVKFKVSLKNGKTLLQGKVWPREEEEPKEWSIETEDPCPNLAGSPGLYAYSVGTTEKSTGTEVFFDNVTVTRD